MQLARGICRSALPPLLVLAAGLSAGCDGGVFVTGRVVDSQGWPLTGASLALEHPSHWNFKAESDADGCFVVGGLTAPGRYDHLLRAETPGHQTATGKVQTGKQNYATIVLAPLAPLAQDDASPGPSSITLVAGNPCSFQARRGAPPAAPPRP